MKLACLVLVDKWAEKFKLRVRRQSEFRGNPWLNTKYNLCIEKNQDKYEGCLVKVMKKKKRSRNKESKFIRARKEKLLSRKK